MISTIIKSENNRGDDEDNNKVYKDNEDDKSDVENDVENEND